jgi:hypothetical protein
MLRSAFEISIETSEDFMAKNDVKTVEAEFWTVETGEIVGYFNVSLHEGGLTEPSRDFQ